MEQAFPEVILLDLNMPVMGRMAIPGSLNGDNTSGNTQTLCGILIHQPCGYRTRPLFFYLRSDLVTKPIASGTARRDC
ncbi:MAG: hypothetical protein QM743_00470 [Chitinophagaceae bacterium]